MAVNIVERGSSPRGRGKPDHAKNPRNRARLIPARAGKTVGVCPYCGMWWAHPRAGGENENLPAAGAGWDGSSPRGRGKPRAVMTSAAPLRLIPARAGKTTRRRASPPTSRAHPRAGGENRSAPVENRQQEGSSPRGRGKHSHAIPERLHPRLIPARAGKTGGVVRRIAALAAHPRAGGENSSHSSRSSAPPGSSPRGRGKRPSTKKDPRPYGLIPARAGKTHGLVTKASSKPAHPRAGGENVSRLA